MSARMICYPVGNGDTTLLDPESHRLVLVDFCNRAVDAGDDDKRIELSVALDVELKRANREKFDVVAFSHLDLDHIGGASRYFHLDHDKKYQGGQRRKIETMWVPAAIITEVESVERRFEEDHTAVQDEARHRLRAGHSIVVFSCPPDLKDWLKKNGISEESRKACICHAGKLAPGFIKATDGIEFFVHAPMSSDEDISRDVARNECSLILQAVFSAGGSDTKVLLLSDANHELLTDVVERTEKMNNLDRLEWDIAHTPHHCSYLSIGPEKGGTQTKPVPEVERLYEKYGQERGSVIVSSDIIPKTDETQPPHRQAATYYQKVSVQHTGMFRVTMEYPTKAKPAAMEIAIEYDGPRIVSSAIVGSAGIVGNRAPRAG